jgi:hypothetical protein
MAWIVLAIVSLLYFAPWFGIAPQRISQELVALIPLPGISIAFPIPGTGAIRVLFEVGGIFLLMWAVLVLPDWWLARKALVEKREYKDFLKRIGDWLWNDLVKAFRPPLVNGLAVRLAQYALIVMASKLLVGYLLQLGVDYVLPLAGDFLVSQFGSEVATLIGSALGDTAKGLADFGMDDNGIILLLASALVLGAEKVYQFERGYRYQYAIQQAQNKARVQQKEIAIPASQV